MKSFSETARIWMCTKITIKQQIIWIVTSREALRKLVELNCYGALWEVFLLGGAIKNESDKKNQ